MDADRTCSRCGKVIPPNESRCPWCADSNAAPPSPREVTLFLGIAGLLVLFLITGFATGLYHSKERALGEEWYARGKADLQQGMANRAIEDFRAALVYSRENSLYRLRLAQALVAANRLDEARAYLLTLWELQPGDGTVNLELARVTAAEGNVTEAVRYYHNAVFGVWPEDPERRRREVWLELCEFLLSRAKIMEAQAELTELAADLPADASLHVQVGNLFMRAEDYPYALAQFQQALRLNGREEDALKGASEAAFQMSDYQRARRHLERLAHLDPQDAHATHLLETTNLILSSDPFARGLSSQERARRAVRAFQQALARLQKCARDRNEVLETPKPETEVQKIYARALAIRPKVRERILQRNPDLLTTTADLVFKIEQLAERRCGAATGLDLALLYVARLRAGAEP